MANTSADKTLARLKGLRAQMREGEQPIFSIPAIWANATERESNACDLIVTNQRIFGYIYTTFPRERLFLDALELDQIHRISLREKSFEGVFRELLVSDGEKRVYIRATRKKIEQTYAALQQAIAENAPATLTALETDANNEQQIGPTYSREQVRQPLERSPMGITLLLVGGLLLEVIGVLIWAATGSMQTGLPLMLAGVVAVLVATLARRQLR